MGAILLLTAVGFVLILTEMILPGGVLGMVGGLALIGAVVLGYMDFGMLAGTEIFCALGLSTLIGFCVWMAVFPRTAIGRRLTLGSGLNTGNTLPDLTPLVGGEGVALTLLRPSGKALIAECRVDVVAEGEFIEANAPIVVVAVEGARVVVRRKASASQPSHESMTKPPVPL